jgi:hypothetical protein
VQGISKQKKRQRMIQIKDSDLAQAAEQGIDKYLQKFVHALFGCLS